VKTGLFFGSFNPVHIGHLIIANQFAQNAGLDQVWFVVSPQNPLKDSRELLDQQHRLNMVQLAINDNPALKACDIEFHLPRPSYTIDTLHELNQHYPENTWALIMGADTVDTLPKWKNYEELVSKYEMLVYPRPNYPIDEARLPPGIKLINDVPVIDISATYTRTAIKSGKNCRYLLPEKVYEYIMVNGLYGNKSI